ncbi:MAG: hemin uptake protein HemP [Phyllobacterium sp.]|uniref:hemin uptake protein HemP n=1 Tax=Phyllobacterium sp. TaxID=1871046 RepID=UPI0030EFBEF8
MSRRQILDLQVRLPNRVSRPAAPAQLSAPGFRVLGSDALFDGSKEVGIEHAGSLYRLKITRQGKLILNK